MRIKEGDEWKAVFTTPEELFEPMVMFFGLTNSLVMFQTIMNEILWDLINTRRVMSFIDNVIIGTEEEEGYNELVEEVVRRLVENNLYVKLEKCKWKVKKVGFLGVIIGLEGIKMEENKVKGVIDWPTPKCVKDVQKVFGFGELLLSVYPKLCNYSQTIVQYSQERSEVELDREAGKGIWETERKIYKGTGISNTRSR